MITGRRSCVKHDWIHMHYTSTHILTILWNMWLSSIGAIGSFTRRCKQWPAISCHGYVMIRVETRLFFEHSVYNSYVHLRQFTLRFLTISYRFDMPCSNRFRGERRQQSIGLGVVFSLPDHILFKLAYYWSNCRSIIQGPPLLCRQSGSRQSRDSM